jgi:ketosteroid isomerase-like protein
LRRWLDTTFAQVTLSGQYTSSEVTVSGDWAVDRYAGTLTATPKGGGAPMQEQIKGVHIMRRDTDGTWRIAQDIWNTDAAPPPPPPPSPTPTKR